MNMRSFNTSSKFNAGARPTTTERCKSSISKSSSSASISRKSTVIESHSQMLHTPLYNKNISDRLVSDQGLITPKERMKTSSRKVRDKSFYVAQLLQKGHEVKAEIKKLSTEINSMNKNQLAYLAYKKKAEMQATELQELHKTFSDYNLLDDILTTEVELSEIRHDYETLKAQNDYENTALEEMFEMRKQQETLAAELETDIGQEIYVSDILASTMNPEIREKYVKLKRNDDKFQMKISEQQQELQQLNSEVEEMEDYCTLLHGLEVCNLLRKLRHVSDQRDEIFSNKCFKDSNSENEYLQKKFRENNEIILCISQQIRFLNSQIPIVQSELDAINEETEYAYSERASKYSKLKNREKLIDSFLSSYEENESNLLTEKLTHEAAIKSLLEKISNKLTATSRSSDFDLCKSDGNNEMNSNEALLRKERENLILSLTEMDSLQEKVQEELESVQQEIAEKEKALILYSDMDKLKKIGEEKTKQVIIQMENIRKQPDTLKLINNRAMEYYEDRKKQLHDNETYSELSKLEKNWHQLEKENYSLKENIASMQAHMDYSLVKADVKKTLYELNEMLKRINFSDI